MNIEIIANTSQLSSNLDSTRNFGLYLNKNLSCIKMLHWYIKDYNIHKIFGDLYEDLNDLFDELQEEIIGTSKNSDMLFPNLNVQLDIDDLNFYKENEDIINCFSNLSMQFKNVLCSLDFVNYVNSVQSGINNIKEEILSKINKTEYLLGMVKL